MGNISDAKFCEYKQKYKRFEVLAFRTMPKELQDTKALVFYDGETVIDIFFKKGESIPIEYFKPEEDCLVEFPSGELGIVTLNFDHLLEGV